MKIDGRQIAARIYEDLKSRVGELKKIGITPHLTVILIGKNPASIAYVNQKKKWGKFIGAKITILRYPESVTIEELAKKIHDLNADPDNHAILIQRPVPKQIDTNKLELLVNPQKDVDGFHPGSPYTLPLPLAVIKILEEIYKKKFSTLNSQLSTFQDWLKSQDIVLLGKGPTGGGPILKYLHKLGLHPSQIDSKTQNPDELIKKTDIVISAVGKPNIITPEKIKKGVILIGVGISRGKDRKLHGDYKEKNIKNLASFYTPTPGGVGPVNVAMLLNNLLNAAEKQTRKNII